MTTTDPRAVTTSATTYRHPGMPATDPRAVTTSATTYRHPGATR